MSNPNQTLLLGLQQSSVQFLARIGGKESSGCYLKARGSMPTSHGPHKPNLSNSESAAKVSYPAVRYGELSAACRMPLSCLCFLDIHVCIPTVQICRRAAMCSHCRSSLEPISTAFVMSCHAKTEKMLHASGCPGASVPWVFLAGTSWTNSIRGKLCHGTLQYPSAKNSTNKSCLWIVRTCPLLHTFLVNVSIKDSKGLPLCMIQHVRICQTWARRQAGMFACCGQSSSRKISRVGRGKTWLSHAFLLPQCSHNFPQWSHKARWLVQCWYISQPAVVEECHGNSWSVHAIEARRIWKLPISKIELNGLTLCLLSTLSPAWSCSRASRSLRASEQCPNRSKRDSMSQRYNMIYIFNPAMTNIRNMNTLIYVEKYFESWNRLKIDSNNLQQSNAHHTRSRWWLCSPGKWCPLVSLGAQTSAWFHNVQCQWPESDKVQKIPATKSTNLKQLQFYRWF